MAYCPGCSEDNLDDAIFCTACGKPLPESAKPASASAASSVEAQAGTGWRRSVIFGPSSRLAAAAGLIAGLVLGFGLAELIIGSGKSGPDPTQTLALNVSPTPTTSGRLGLMPSSGTILAGDVFFVELVVSAREPFTAAQAAVSVSSNLAVQSIAEPPSTHGPCDFTTYARRPTPADPSFAGSYASGFASLSCTVYVMGIKALRAGTATITLSGESIIASGDGHDLFGGATTGKYTIAGTAPPDDSTPTAQGGLDGTGRAINASGTVPAALVPATPWIETRAGARRGLA